MKLYTHCNYNFDIRRDALMDSYRPALGVPEVVVSGYFLLAEKIQRQAFILEFPKLKNQEKRLLLSALGVSRSLIVSPHPPVGKTIDDERQNWLGLKLD